MKRYRVVPNDRQWQVKSEGSGRAVSVHPTKDDALRFARNIAAHQGGEVIVHRRDGQIQGSWTYGGDHLLPPRDSRTGSFTTRKSTTTIKATVHKFSDTLERLAKK